MELNREIPVLLPIVAYRELFQKNQENALPTADSLFCAVNLWSLYRVIVCIMPANAAASSELPSDSVIVAILDTYRE